MSINTRANLLFILYIVILFHYAYSQSNSTSSTKKEDSQGLPQMKKFNIDNAIYIIRNFNSDKNLDIERGDNLVFLNNPKKPLKKHFRIISVDGNTNLPSKDINSNVYYCIEDKDYHKRLGVVNMSGNIGLKQPKENINKIDDNYLWKIFPILIESQIDNKKYKRIYYYLQNKATMKYLSYIEVRNNIGSFICNCNDLNKLNYNNYFILNKMYRERNPYESMELIDKEPIDVLIKYIDLSDPNLKREGIKQIKKDEENGEIIYSVRSILQYIPWVRKIFILMPNEKIKYFKEPEEIKDKIVYVKDKDLLGFDSASSIVFQFNLWRMKQFGLSENFILMDDDCFIGKPLKKSDFFYEENNTIYPALITADYYELSKLHLEKTLKTLLDSKKPKGPHSANGFSIMQRSTLLFLYSILGDDIERNGQPLIEASFTHNAIPVKQSHIKEIYDDIIKLYPYAKETLESKERDIKSLQPQTLYMSYVKNKYDQRVKMVSSRFFDLMQFRGKVNSGLFVINTSDKVYPIRFFINEIKQLKLLYSKSSPYENSVAVKLFEEKITIYNRNQPNNKNQQNNRNQQSNRNQPNNRNRPINRNQPNNRNQQNNKNQHNNKNQQNNENQIKNKNLKTNQNIKETNQKQNKNENDNKKRENEMKLKDDKKINTEFYDSIFNFLKYVLNEKNNYYKDILEIKDNIDNLNKKYDETLKEIEELSNKLNNSIRQNISLGEYKGKKVSKFKFFELLVLIVIIFCFILYLNKKGYFNENSNNDLNYGFGNISNERELNMIDSKLVI